MKKIAILLSLIVSVSATQLKVPSAYSTIQSAIDASSNGDTVSVAAGTYTENINFNGKNIVVLGEDKETTIIDGNNNASVVTFKSGEDSNAVLNGFTIKNGKMTSYSTGHGGGGIHIRDSSPTLSELIITDNKAYSGGGIYIDFPSSTHSLPMPSINSSIIIGNDASDGAGILFYGNIQGPIINNCLIVSNTGGFSTGVEVYDEWTMPTLINVTIANHDIGIEQSYGGSVIVKNSIIWGNGNSVYGREGSTNQLKEATYSIIYGGHTGTGNIDTDPKFLKVITTGDEESDYHLKDSSPAIGAGTATGAPTTDIEGNPRPNPAGSNPDMGAFENKYGSPQPLDGTSSFNDKGTKEITFNVELPTHSLPDNNISLGFWKSGAENHECTGCNGRDTVSMRKLSDDHWEATVGLDTTLVANGETGESQYWYHYFKTIPDYKIKEDLERFKLETNPDGLRELKHGWHKQSSLSNKDIVIAWQNIAPVSFDWISAASATINISQSNLTEEYELKWSESKDVDGETIDYLLHAQIGIYPAKEIYDTTSTSVQITYEEFLENVFELFPILPGATVRFSVLATDGKDTLKVTGDDRVLFVNRYDYLSIAAEGVPLEFALHENYPNPFNPTTTLRFDLPEVSDITLTIYNMLGQKVRTFDYQNTSAGYHSVTWDATNDYGDPVGAGVYLYQLRADQFVKTRKMVLLK